MLTASHSEVQQALSKQSNLDEDDNNSTAQNTLDELLPAVGFTSTGPIHFGPIESETTGHGRLAHQLVLQRRADVRADPNDLVLTPRAARAAGQRPDATSFGARLAARLAQRLAPPQIVSD